MCAAVSYAYGDDGSFTVTCEAEHHLCELPVMADTVNVTIDGEVAIQKIDANGTFNFEDVKYLMFALLLLFSLMMTTKTVIAIWT